MKIYLGSDHNGHEIEPKLIEWLETNGHSVETFSNKELVSDDDYPDFAYPVAKAVSKDENARGIVVCGSGGGVCVVANKVKNARCVLAMNDEQSKFARKDDNANILSLSARYSSLEDMRKMITTFLTTDFETGGRHERRFHKVEEIESKEFK
ncbi:MAG: RpiB/LacA/LacB family sugar-phosphate isomerase [Candidatus Gracilibacteria bacterium]